MFERLWRGRRTRPFHAWQVELTTRCGLNCTMCARPHGKDGAFADMALHDFEGLEPYFSDVDAVVLEGWGEPLLYPHLPECIRLVKKAGAEAGFVTSGQGMDEQCIRQLLDSGIDFLGVSISGAFSGTHNRIRVGSDLTRVVASIRLLSRIKRERGLSTPRVHLVYLMMKENMEELPDFISLAQTLDIGNVVLLNQTAVADEWQNAQRVFNAPEADHYEAVLKETAIRALESGIRIRRPSLYPAEVALCDENPLRNLYIDVQGNVSPCVFLNPPAPRADGGMSPSTPQVFGNIFRQPFEEIWMGEGYRRFRGPFEARTRTLDELHARLGGLGMDVPPTTGLLHEAPEPCRGCCRIMGA
jgi:MoaA/NifB/PqqE/SkfB family radical SAM enzyme